MKIIVDAMGGDNAPNEIIKGALEALKYNKDDLQIAFVGIKEVIEKYLKKYKATSMLESGELSIIHAEEVIDNNETPVKAIRTKKKSSIVIGLQSLKKGDGDLFISAGNTGAIMAGSLFILGRIQGIDRPAIASVYPILGSKPAILLDAGANSECKPNNLLEFATMGSIYMEKVVGIEKPKVGLVNLGVEENKGSTLTKAAYELLKKSPLNFIGNVEGRGIPMGECDVIVCDGFVGNIILKLTEGLALNMMSILKKTFLSNLKTKMGALFLKKEISGLREEFDYTEYGGAPILGVRGPVIKMHGSSDAKAVRNSIIKAIPFIKEGVIDIIENHVIELEEIINDEEE